MLHWYTMVQCVISLPVGMPLLAIQPMWQCYFQFAPPPCPLVGEANFGRAIGGLTMVSTFCFFVLYSVHSYYYFVDLDVQYDNN